MKTKGEIEFEILDTTAIVDSNIIVPDENIQDYSNLSEIVQEDINYINYITLENNFSVLDGSLMLLDDDNNEGNGFSSYSMTDTNGDFSWYSMLCIEFEEYHTSPGITILFNGDSYSTDFTVNYYRDNSLIFSDNYSADKMSYYCEEGSIEGYNKIEIIFRKMNNGNRYVKISHIYFGCIKIFGEDLLISSKTTQETDLTSSELNISKVSFKVSNNDRKFSLLNPQGIYSSLQDKQKIRAYEYLDNKKMLLGTFYLKNWKNTSEYVADFEAQDVIGLMDTSIFYGGMYDNVNSEIIIDEILKDCNVKYILAENLKGISITGYIPKCSHREALQQVLFVLGAIANTSGSELLELYIPETTLVRSRITKNRKHTKKNEVSIYNIVTGLDITYFTYKAMSNLEEIYNEEMDTGIHIIEFSNPVVKNSIVVSNATVIIKGVNFVKIEVHEDNTIVTINACKYEETKTTLELRKERTTEAENNLSIKDATLINKLNVKNIGNRILEFYEKKYKMECQYKLQNEKIGDCVSIESLYESRIFGNIQKMTINMTGGAIVECVTLGLLLRGFTEYNCCGEFYCNDGNFYREMN